MAGPPPILQLGEGRWLISPQSCCFKGCGFMACGGVGSLHGQEGDGERREFDPLW